jgi:hypothetical protein
MPEQFELQRLVAGPGVDLEPCATRSCSDTLDMTSEQIGGRLDVAAGTVRWRMKTAREQLRERETLRTIVSVL